MNEGGPGNPFKKGPIKNIQEEAPANLEIIKKGVEELEKIKVAAENIRSLVSLDKFIENYQKGGTGLALDEGAPSVVKENIATIASFFDTKNAVFSTFKDEFLKLGVDATIKDRNNKTLLLDGRDCLEKIQGEVVVFSEGQELFEPYLETLKKPENENLGVNHDHASQVIRMLISKASTLSFDIEDLIEYVEKLKTAAGK